MYIFDNKAHYENNYYACKPRKYRTPDGIQREYIGPAASWDGYDPIITFLYETIGKPTTALDIGCGKGDFVRRERNRAVNAFGIDISHDGVENPVHPDLRPFLICDDVSNLKKHFNNKFDLITALDLMEHIYSDEVDDVIKSIYECTGGLFFACICTSNEKYDQNWIYEKGTEVPLSREWQIISGHVTNMPWEWWVEKLERAGFKTKYKEMYEFQVKMTRDLEMATCASWMARNIYIGGVG